MTKKNVTSHAIDIAKLVEYKSFLEKALHRVESGESFDSWISSDLILREDIVLLNELQEAEKIHIGKILRDKLAKINNTIIGGE